MNGDTAGNGGAGSGFHVDPDQLDGQARSIAGLGDGLREHISRNPTEPLMLGTAPPAVKFAQLMAELTGEKGAAGAMRSWADGLAKFGTNQRAAATEYRGTDNAHAEAYRRGSTGHSGTADG